MSTPNTSQVKWVAATDLYDHDGSYVSRIPVIPLSDLADVVEYLREQVRYHDPLCMDNIEEDGCTCGHATAQRLLAQLEAQAEGGA